MDLEWNNAYCKKNKGFLNEIIEIGAVKMDENLNVVDTFSMFIKAQLGKKLHSRVKALTNITNDDISNGTPFSQAMALFRKWSAGNDNIFLTWGDTDIRVLIENFRYFNGISFIPFLSNYVNLQKYAQAFMNISKADQIGLSAAAEKLDIDIESYSLHRALDDSLLTADLFKKIYNHHMLASYTLVCDNSFYSKITFKPKLITDINSPLIDKTKMVCICDTCGNSCERISEWRVMNQSFRAVFCCKKCKKKIRFTVRFKEYYDRVDIKTSTVPFIEKKDISVTAKSGDKNKIRRVQMNIPIKLTPVFKEIVWGGNRLKEDYGFKSELNNIAEAWMLCARDDGDNIIENGEFKGTSFTQFIKNNRNVLGTKGDKYEEFPLLIKFIDAKTDLSVQVHPDDEYAKAYENSYGKTEAWYILDCEEGAELVFGFNKELSREEFKKSIEDNTFLDYVNKVKVKKGDVFFISAGTLHAIGSGILLAEVQQNCNTTYRVYDYNRKVNGIPRELHVEKALDVTNTVPQFKGGDPEFTPEIKGDATEQHLCDCEFFNMDTIDIDGKYTFNVTEESFCSLLVLSGEGTIYCNDYDISIKSGESIFVPAGSGEVDVKGNIKLLISTL